MNDVQSNLSLDVFIFDTNTSELAEAEFLNGKFDFSYVISPYSFFHYQNGSLAGPSVRKPADYYAEFAIFHISRFCRRYALIALPINRAIIAQNHYTLHRSLSLLCVYNGCMVAPSLLLEVDCAG